MKYGMILVTALFLFSCGKEKVVMLPEITHSEITEIKDVSAAYLFYNETQPDSVELNRKNLISTTNWLVNVDKRLTLEQVIPRIKCLQNKKANSSHKNINAKNYFTCNDTIIKNLSFLEFTDVIYHETSDGFVVNPNTDITHLLVLDDNEINIVTPDNRIFYANKASLLSVIEDSLAVNQEEYKIFMGFEKGLTFQDYISIKSVLSQIKSENIDISNHEGISN